MIEKIGYCFDIITLMKRQVISMLPDIISCEMIKYNGNRYWNISIISEDYSDSEINLILRCYYSSNPVEHSDYGIYFSEDGADFTLDSIKKEISNAMEYFMEHSCGN